MEVSGQFHDHGRFTPGTHWIGGWVGPRGGLDDVEKSKISFLPGIEPRKFSPSLYWILLRET
jgi:hypothetical protein